MSSPLFQTLDIEQVRQTLDRLHELIARGSGRIEITRNGCDDCCILISKSELESLEQALEIFSSMDGPRAARQELEDLASSIADLPAAHNGQ